MTDKDTMRRRIDRLKAENARQRDALVKIACGKQREDNGHPLGEYASMAMRFVTIAQDALRSEPGGDAP